MTHSIHPANADSVSLNENQIMKESTTIRDATNTPLQSIQDSISTQASSPSQTIQSTPSESISTQAKHSAPSTIITSARVRNILNSDPDTPKISKKGLLAVTKGTELFVQHLISRTLAENEIRNSKKRLDLDNIQKMIRKDPELLFLRDMTDKETINRFMSQQ